MSYITIYKILALIALSLIILPFIYVEYDFNKTISMLCARKSVAKPSNCHRKLRRILKGYGTQLGSIIYVGASGSVQKFNMSYESFFSKCLRKPVIRINSRWACFVLLEAENEMVNQAFVSRLGHELAHHQCRKQEFSCLWRYRTKSDKTFLSWINEVHADYLGVLLTGNGNSTHFIKATNFIMKNSEQEKASSTTSHPSRNQRIKYVEKKRFDMDLIKDIARATGCTNEHLITEAERRFSRTIVLH